MFICIHNTCMLSWSKMSLMLDNSQNIHVFVHAFCEYIRVWYGSPGRLLHKGSKACLTLSYSHIFVTCLDNLAS